MLSSAGKTGRFWSTGRSRLAAGAAVCAAIALLLLLKPTTQPTPAWDGPAAVAADEATRRAMHMTEFIFTEDRPAPHRNCHASTLVTLPDGTVVAAWFGGHAEKNPDVGIWASRRPAGGEWEPAFLVAKIEEVAHWCVGAIDSLGRCCDGAHDWLGTPCSLAANTRLPKTRDLIKCSAVEC